MNSLWPKYADKRYAGVLRALRGRIALSYVALWFERLARAFWPLATLVLAFYAFTAFEVFLILSAGLGKGVLVLGLLVAVGLLVWGGYRFDVPRRAQAIARMDATRTERPLASLRDHVASNGKDALTRALWERHQAHMARVGALVQVPPAAPHLAVRDRYGLRLMAIVLALLAVVFAPLGFGDVVRQVRSSDRDAVAIAGLSFEAWVNPPQYTDRPVIYLPEVAPGQVLFVPEGSKLVLRVYGLADDLQLQDGVSGQETPLKGESDGLKLASLSIVQNGDVRLRAGRETLANWAFVVEPDAPPVVAFEGTPVAASSGAMQLSFKALDDVGVAAGRAVITLDLDAVERRFGLAPDPVSLPPVVLDLPMPFSGAAKDFSYTLSEDLSAHVWANLPVLISLGVTDVAGQSSAPVTLEIPLPAKVFYLPLAAAIAEQRRDILWSHESDERALRVLRAISFLPADLELSAGKYLILRTAIRRFSNMQADGLDQDERVQAAAMLWDIAVLLEDGTLGDARERLRRAQERLSQALERGADAQELQQLAEELRQATEAYLQALADDAQPGEQQAQGDEAVLDDDAIQQMLDQLQQLMDEGQNREAQQMLEQLGEMLKNLKMTQTPNPAAQTMEQMQDALRQQQTLSDETFRKLQEALRDGAEPGAQDMQELADRQEALRAFLEELGQQPGGDQAPLEDAGENMGDARNSLQNGDAGGALDRQAQALENLREGIRELGEEMQRDAQGRDGMQAGETQDSAGTDPLGRPLGQTGRSETGENLLEERDLPGRARELLDEIRRRSGERDRPEAERDYLKRLLDRF